MFRRQPGSLPKDPVFPADLEALGYFVNEDDQIKSIEHPTDDYSFFVTINERYNEVYRESMHACIRLIIWNRLLKLGLAPLYLPSLSIIKPANPTPSLPIFTTPPAELKEKKNVVIIFNKRAEDLGVWAYRRLSKDAGINRGSALGLISGLLSSPNGDSPGIILTNPGQLLYTHRNDTVNATPNLTPLSWTALPRPSAVHPPRRIDDTLNHVPGNASLTEHFEFILTRLLPDPALIHPDARLYFLGIADGGDALLSLLQTHWRTAGLNDRLAALALTAPSPIVACAPPFPLRTGAPGFLRFLRERVRAWARADMPLDTPLRNAATQVDVDAVVAAGRFAETVQLWHAVSGGESVYAESVIVEAATSVLGWFREVMEEEDAAGGNGYAHPEFVVPEEVLAGLEEERRSREQEAAVDGWSDLESELDAGGE